MTLEQLIEELTKFKQELEKTDYIHEKIEFFKLMRNLRKFIAEVEDSELCGLFFHSDFFEKNKGFFRRTNNYYMRAMEAVEALSIMTKGKHSNNFLDLIDAEQIKERYYNKGKDIGNIDFTNAKNMVMVGCGPLPETILYFYENTPIKNIVGIDNNFEAIYLAGEMVRSLSITNIKLEYCDGINYDYSNADIVYIPGFSYPKDKILKQIVNTSKQDVQIIINVPNKLTKLLYDEIIEDKHLRLFFDKTSENKYIYRNHKFLIGRKYNI